MWDCSVEKLSVADGLRYALRRDGSPVLFADVLRLWQDDASFRTYFIALLSDAPYSAYRWETPPLTIATANRAFEFVLLSNPGLPTTGDATAFAEHFPQDVATKRIVHFTNLGNDAMLIVPCPVVEPDAYAHLAAFVRSAPSEQIHELWRVVGASMQARLATAPTWLSTAGMGVAWLHVRLDSRPKYYGHAPYRVG